MAGYTGEFYLPASSFGYNEARRREDFKNILSVSQSALQSIDENHWDCHGNQPRPPISFSNQM
jgi:hypothetical protein